MEEHAALRNVRVGSIAVLKQLIARQSAIGNRHSKPRVLTSMADLRATQPLNYASVRKQCKSR
jgi:hypothetical protein